jgi:type VI secretion system protein ImpM
VPGQPVRSKQTLLAGYFGKAPTHGDFVAKRIDFPAREALDAWLRSSIDASRAELGAEWLPAFLSAPVWRFYLAENVAGSSPLAGTMIPSVDKVGRYFPFIVTLAFRNPDYAPATLVRVDRWFELFEATLLTVLDDDFDLDHFSELLRARAAMLDVELNGVGALLDLVGNDADELSRALPPRGSAEFSVWWTSGAEHRRPGLLTYTGLPAPAVFSSFLKDPDPHHELSLHMESAKRAGSSSYSNGEIADSGHSEHLVAYARTHPGAGAAYNSEYFGLDTNGGRFFVSDGSFGLERSAETSRFLVRVLDEIEQVDDLEVLARHAQGQIERAMRMLTDRNGKDYGVGVACAALYVRSETYALIWGGPIYAFALRDGVLLPLTPDAFLPTSPESTLVLGKPFKVAYVTAKASSKDRFLLCTHGLGSQANSSELRAVLSGSCADQIVNRLIDDALIAGQPSNLTAVLITLR